MLTLNKGENAVMKQHILAGMQEQLDSWDALLSSMSPEQLNTPLTPSFWTVKIVIAHLYVWQQITNARFNAAASNSEPIFPKWREGLVPEAEGSTDRINAWVYETYRDQSWDEVHQIWQKGYQSLLQTTAQISEVNLLESGIYPWLGSYPLVFFLLASYNHHQEHFDQVTVWLQGNGFTSAS